MKTIMTDVATTKRPLFQERYGRLDAADRSFDLHFWQSQTDEARYAATWDLVVLAQKIKGRSLDELRLQRTVESFGRQSELTQSRRADH